jgi:hypothetical protein
MHFSHKLHDWGNEMTRYALYLKGLDGRICVALPFDADTDAAALRYGAKVQEAHSELYLGFEVQQDDRRI